MLILTLTNSLLFLLTVNALGTLVIYIITCASLIKLRKKKNIPAAAFMLPAGKIIAAVSIIFCLLIMTGSSLLELLYIFGVLGVGAVLYGIFIWEKNRRASPVVNKSEITR